MKLVKIILIPILLAGVAYATLPWSYQGNEGPKDWGKIKSEYQACAIGKQQSPINIDTNQLKTESLPPIQLKLVPARAELELEKYSVEVDIPKGSTAILNGQQYQLKQFHFHNPSETAIDGKYAPLEVHFVFANKQGKLAVIAVLLLAGDKDNATFAQILNNLPTNGKHQVKLKEKLDPNGLLPASLAYYTFPGSLTTPGCGEGVTWFVLKQPVELSKAQVAASKKWIKGNARPVQPLNGRVVLATK